MTLHLLVSIAWRFCRGTIDTVDNDFRRTRYMQDAYKKAVVADITAAVGIKSIFMSGKRSDPRIAIAEAFANASLLVGLITSNWMSLCVKYDGGKLL